MPRPLPTELIEHTLSFVDPNDKQTCSALCACSKLFNRILTPMMYKTVGIAQDLHIKERARRLQSLCRTLLENRNLARHVEGVHQWLDMDSIEKCENHFNAEEYIRTDWHKVLVGNLGLPTDMHESMLATFQSRRATEELFFIELLMLCPKVENLTLYGNLAVVRRLGTLGYALRGMGEENAWSDLDDEDDDKDDEAGVDEGGFDEDDENVAVPDETDSPSQFGLQTIKYVHLEHTSFDNDIGVEDLEVLLLFPSIQSLQSDRLDRTITKGSSYDLDLYSSNVKELHINGFFGKIEDLMWLLPACPNLLSLTVEFGSSEDAHLNHWWSHLGQNIAEYCPNLEHLRLDHRALDDWERKHLPNSYDEYLESAELEPLSSLHELPRLKQLIVTKNALLGSGDDANYEFDIQAEPGAIQQAARLSGLQLPESLEELTVICPENYKKQLLRCEKALVTEPCLQHLKEVTVYDCQKHECFTKTDGERTSAKRKNNNENRNRKAKMRAQHASTEDDTSSQSA